MNYSTIKKTKDDYIKYITEHFGPITKKDATLEDATLYKWMADIKTEKPKRVQYI